MIKKIRLMLEYNTYCIWLYDENDQIIDNENPPGLEDDEELTNAFMSVSDLYDSFFIDNDQEFRFAGCPNDETRSELISRINHAVDILQAKTNGEYIIQNDINTSF